MASAETQISLLVNVNMCFIAACGGPPPRGGRYGGRAMLAPTRATHYGDAVGDDDHIVPKRLLLEEKLSPKVTDVV